MFLAQPLYVIVSGDDKKIGLGREEQSQYTPSASSVEEMVEIYMYLMPGYLV